MAKKKKGGMIPGGMDSTLKKVRDSTANAPASSAEKTLKGAKPLPPYASVAPTVKSDRLFNNYDSFRKSVDGDRKRRDIITGDLGQTDGMRKSKKTGRSSRASKRRQADYFDSKIYWIKKNNPAVRGITKNKKGKK